LVYRSVCKNIKSLSFRVSGYLRQILFSTKKCIVEYASKEID